MSPSEDSYIISSALDSNMHMKKSNNKEMGVLTLSSKSKAVTNNNGSNDSMDKGSQYRDEYYGYGDGSSNVVDTELAGVLGRLGRAFVVLVVMLCVLPALFSYKLLHHSAMINNVCFVNGNNHWNGIYQSFGGASYHYSKIVPFSSSPSNLSYFPSNGANENNILTFLKSSSVWTTALQWSPRYTREFKTIKQQLQQNQLHQQDSPITSAYSQAIDWDSQKSRWCLTSLKNQNNNYDSTSNNNNNENFENLTLDNMIEENSQICTEQVPTILSDVSVAPYFPELPLSPPNNGKWYNSQSKGMKRKPSSLHSTHLNERKSFWAQIIYTLQSRLPFVQKMSGARSSEKNENSNDLEEDESSTLFLEHMLNPNDNYNDEEEGIVHVSCHVAPKSLKLSANGLVSNGPSLENQFLISDLLQLPATFILIILCIVLYLQSKTYLWAPKIYKLEQWANSFFKRCFCNMSTSFDNNNDLTIWEDEFLCCCGMTSAPNITTQLLLYVNVQQELYSRPKTVTHQSKCVYEQFYPWKCWISRWIHAQWTLLIFNLYNLYWLGATLEEDIGSLPFFLHTVSFTVISIVLELLLHHLSTTYYSKSNNTNKTKRRQMQQDTSSDDDTSIKKLLSGGLTPTILAWMIVASLERSMLIPIPWLSMIQVSTTYGIFNGIIGFNILLLAKLFNCSIHGMAAGILIGNAWHYSYQIFVFQESILSTFFNITLFWSPMLWIPLSCLIYVRYVLKVPFISTNKDDDGQYLNAFTQKSSIGNYPYNSKNIKRKKFDGKLYHYGPLINAITRRTLKDDDSISVDICDIIDEHDQSTLEQAVDLEIHNFFNNDQNDTSFSASPTKKIMDDPNLTTRPIASIERILLPLLCLLMMFMTIKSWILHDHVMMAGQFFTTILFMMGIKSRFQDEWNMDEVSCDTPCSNTNIILRCAYLSCCSNVIFDAMTYGSWIHYFYFNPPVTYLWMLGTRILMYSLTLAIIASILNKRCLIDDDPCLLLLPGTTIAIFDLARTLGNQVLISHNLDFLFRYCPFGASSGRSWKKNKEFTSYQTE